MLIHVFIIFSWSQQSPALRTNTHDWVVQVKQNLNFFVYSNYLNTGQVWYFNGRFVSACQMIRYLNGGLKTGLIKILFMVQNVQDLNSLPSHATLPF